MAHEPEYAWLPWLRLAEADLDMAGILADGSAVPWGVCYHVQQAVEKAMKALTQARGDDPPFTHNLVRLNRGLSPAPFGADDEERLADLSVWSIQQRYPADQPELTSDDAGNALQFGRLALERIRALLETEEPA